MTVAANGACRNDLRPCAARRWGGVLCRPLPRGSVAVGTEPRRERPPLGAREAVRAAANGRSRLGSACPCWTLLVQDRSRPTFRTVARRLSQRNARGSSVDERQGYVVNPSGRDGHDVRRGRASCSGILFIAPGDAIAHARIGDGVSGPDDANSNADELLDERLSGTNCVRYSTGCSSTVLLPPMCSPRSWLTAGDPHRCQRGFGLRLDTERLAIPETAVLEARGHAAAIPVAKPGEPRAYGTTSRPPAEGEASATRAQPHEDAIGCCHPLSIGVGAYRSSFPPGCAGPTMPRNTVEWAPTSALRSVCLWCSEPVL